MHASIILYNVTHRLQITSPYVLCIENMFDFPDKYISVLYVKGHLKKKSCIAKGYTHKGRGKLQWRSPLLPVVYCCSMMMKSSTFFFPFLSRLDPFYPSPPRRAHNTRFGLIASISHRELFTKFHVLQNHVKKKSTLNSSSVTTSTIEVHCPSLAVREHNTVILTSTSFPPFGYSDTHTRFVRSFFFSRYLFCPPTIADILGVNRNILCNLVKSTIHTHTLGNVSYFHTK